MTIGVPSIARFPRRRMRHRRDPDRDRPAHDRQS